MNLNNLRKQIDRLDEDIVHKLNRRLEIGLRIRNLKRKLGKGVYSPEREYQVFKKLKDIPREYLSDSALEAIYR